MTATIDIGITSIEREELIQRLRWLIRLRWAIGAMLLVAIPALHAMSRFAVNPQGILGVGVAILIYNALFDVIERWLSKRHPELRSHRAPTAASFQIVLDLIAITFVLHFSGGVENPFFVFYIFHIIIATLLLPVRDVFLLAGLSIALFGGLIVGEMVGVWSHSYLLTDHEYYRDPWVVALTLSALASSQLIAAQLGTSISRRLRAREREILLLEKQLEDRADELERAYTKLQRIDQQKTKHFRQLSHELKAPLGAQQSLLNAVLIELDNKAPDAALQRIQRAVKRGDDLFKLLTDMLELSDARDTLHEQVQEWINPSERLRAVLEDRIVQAQTKDLELDIEIPPILPAICVRPGTLETIVDNLVSNAIKYTPRGGSITLHVFGESQSLTIEVTDTGIGINPNDIDKIGQEFFRTTDARATGVGGTGLGMAIVRSIVESIGGTFNVDSQPGHGTAFAVSIPVVDPHGRQACGLPM